MVHTAKLYVALEDEQIYELERRHEENISLLGDKLNKKYNGITVTFTKKYFRWYMFVTVDFIMFLGKSNVAESDYSEVERKMDNFLYYVFGNLKAETVLTRIDYRLDARMESKEERKLLFHIYSKTIDKYRFKKKYDQYDTSVYFNSKSMQCIAYDKEKERDDKGVEIEDYEKNILRFETRLQNRHLNYMKHSNGVEKRLENYFKDELYRKYMEKNLGCLLYKGDYYKIKSTKKVIDKSSLKERDKALVREFLVDVSKRGITGTKKMLGDKGKEKYSKYKFDKAIEFLEKLGINPILIPQNRKGPSYLKNPFEVQ